MSVTIKLLNFLVLQWVFMRVFKRTIWSKVGQSVNGGKSYYVLSIGSVPLSGILGGIKYTSKSRFFQITKEKTFRLKRWVKLNKINGKKR